MADKQQIEEMTIAEMVASYLDCNNIKVSNQLLPLHIEDIILKAGYHKVPKNAVVLTREEFDRLNSCIKSEEEVRAIMQQQMLPMVRELTDKEVGKKLATVTALVRKETAKEIYITGKYYYAKHRPTGRQLSDFLAHIKETYGVEVEE